MATGLEAQITTIQPGSPSHDALKRNQDREVKRRPSIEYNKLAEAYNKARLDAYIKLDPGFGRSLSNLVKVLEYRGLDRDVDFSLLKVSKDVDGRPLPKKGHHLIVHKLSEARMQLL